MQGLSQLLIATRNRGKVREFEEMLAALSVEIHTLAEFPEIAEVEESGATFADNAALKASFYSRQTGLRALADDSGLEVDALGGAPGVFSARYGGAGATDSERMERLLAALNKTGDSERRARFVCVIALAYPLTNELKFFTGTCEGRIAHEPLGAGGFGYDPLFIPENYEQTFGQLPTEIKHRISHRARALQAATAFLRQSIP